MKIPIEKIVVSKDNPRQTFDEEGLRRLGESIKNHGLLQPVIVRPKGSFFELVVGERRLRASALVGINDIEAKVEDIDDATGMELRLIENTQREDLTDAEKGDAVLSLWANYDKYTTLKDVAEAINIPYSNLIARWIPKARKLSERVKTLVITDDNFSDEHARYLMKYPHSMQNKIANISLSYSLTKRQVIELTKKLDANPNANLDKLAKEVSGFKEIEVPKSMLTEEQKQKLEEKRQLAKVKRIRKKPSKPITKEQVKKRLGIDIKKTDFKFERVKVTRGSGGVEPPKPVIKPNILETTKPKPTPEWSLCKCPMCPLFGKDCKGRFYSK